ncbi:MAG: DUF6544 family protein [Acidobacteriota bacterium]
MLILGGVIVLVAGVLALRLWRFSDGRADRRLWDSLARTVPTGEQVRFDSAMVDGLPAAARRYFSYSIQPGTPLVSAVELEMEGEIGLGTRDKPGYRPMRARQILAPPHGLVWRVRSGSIAGSDGASTSQSWTRFWLFGVLPVVRAGGNADHRRAAFGRVVAEAAFWAPASLLPGPHVTWHGVDEATARAEVRFGGLAQVVEVTVDDSGEPRQVVIERWSNANRDKVYRLQPFGGVPSRFRDCEGYRLPTRVEGGNFFGTEDYFPFFKATVTTLRAAVPLSR